MKFKKLLRPFLCLALCALCACGKSPEQIAKERKNAIDAAVVRAQTLLFDQKTDEALEILAAAYGMHGEDPKLCETMAYAYSESGQPALAGVYFEKAHALDMQNNILCLSAAKSYEQAQAFEQAAKMYERYLSADMKDFLAWKSLAKVYEKLARYQDSLNAHMNFLKVAGRNADTEEGADIGLLFLKLGNKTQAQKWLEAALSATAADNAATRARILLGLTDIYLAEKDMAKLDETVAALDAIDPKLIDQSHPALRAQLKEFRDKLEEARKALEQAQEQKTLEEKKAREEAERAEAEKRALEEKKAALLKRAEEEKALAEEKKRAEGEAPAVAAEKITDVATLPESKKEDDAAAYVGRVFENIEKGDVRAAERAGHRAVAKDSASFETWRALAKAYEAAGKASDAYLAARESMLRNPEDLDANLFYLRCSAKVLQHDKLLDALYAAHARFPTNSEIILGLARAYAVAGNKNNAVYFYKKFLADTTDEHPLHADAAQEYAQLAAQQ